jgi:hypothetical protein
VKNLNPTRAPLTPSYYSNLDVKQEYYRRIDRELEYAENYSMRQKYPNAK